MHYLFTSGNIYEKIITSVTAGRPFGYGLIFYRRAETKERNNTNEIIDRATWRSGLFH